MSKKTNQQGILALSILAVLVLVGISFAGFNNRSADCPNGPMRASLTGGDIDGKAPSGTVFFNEKRNSGLSVKVKSVNVPNNTALTVFVGDTNVGQINVSRSGNGELKLDTTNVTEGAIITVKNGENILLTGSFACVANNSSRTATPTATANVSATETATATPTATATATPTATATATPTVEPTVTPTPTMTATPTLTPTLTPTITPPWPM